MTELLLTEQLNHSSDLWVRLLLSFAGKSLALLTLATLLAMLLHRASAAAKHWVWTLAVVGVLLLPLVSLLLPQWRVNLLPDLARPLASQAEPSATENLLETPPLLKQAAQALKPISPPSVKELPASPAPRNALTEEEPLPAPIVGVTQTATEPKPASQWPTWLLLGWLVGVALIFGRLLLGTLSAWWLVRSAYEITDDAWVSLTQYLGWRFGLKREVRLLASNQVHSPITCGVFRPAILIPDSVNEWPPERRYVVLSHELAHIKRRDCLTQLLAQIACAIYWFNPLVWVAARRLRIERERACDDFVLSAGTKASDYASHLLEIARSMQPTRLSSVAAVAIAKGSQLEGRLLAILDPNLQRRRLNRIATIALALLLIGVALPLAALQPSAQANPSVNKQRTGDEALPLKTVASAESPASSVTQDRAPLVTTEAAVSDEASAAMLSSESPANLESLPAVEAAQDQQPSAAERAAIQNEALRALQEALKDSDAEVRQNAMQALAMSRNAEAIPLFIEALKDSDPEIRQKAAWALGLRRSSEAVEPLMRLLSDAHAEVRQQAAWALGLQRDARAADGLASLLNDADIEVRQQAAWALGLLRSKSAVAGLTRSLSDSSAEVRQQAAWSLGLIRDRAAVDGLLTALSDSSAEVRQQAAWSLGMIHDERAVDGLKAALKDKNTSVREQAAWALGMILMRQARYADETTDKEKEEESGEQSQPGIAIRNVTNQQVKTQTNLHIGTAIAPKPKPNPKPRPLVQ